MYGIKFWVCEEVANFSAGLNFGGIVKINEPLFGWRNIAQTPD